MNITKLVPESEILKEFSKRLAKLRRAQGFTQTELAERAGIGVATLRRIEGGQDSQFETWIKILKALDRISALNALLPENFNSPMSEALAGKSRKSVGKTRASALSVSEPSPSGVIWGDEIE